jgi:hypothetical protein
MSDENADHPANRREDGNGAFFAEAPADPATGPQNPGTGTAARSENSVKEMLKQCLDAQRDAEFIEERIARLKSLQERMTTRLTGLPRGTLQFDQSAEIAEIEELKVELARRVLFATLKAGRLFRMMAGLPEN